MIFKKKQTLGPYSLDSIFLFFSHNQFVCILLGANLYDLTCTILSDFTEG